MKKIFTLILALAGLFLYTAKADTPVSGTISTDSIWDLAGSPYIVTSTIIVSDGATLTIDSGVIVRFQGNQGMVVSGTLDAYKCIFRSDASIQNEGDWSEIGIGTAGDAGTADFYGCVIEYGGRSTANDSYGMVVIERGTANFNGNCEVRHSNNAGILVGTNGTVHLSSTVISGNGRPVVYSGPGSVFLHQGNAFIGNTTDVIYLNFSQSTNNFVLDTASVPYEFSGVYTVAGGTMEILSGNEVRMNSSLRIRGGVLNAYYTSFTSAESPQAKGDWDEIEVGYASTSGEASFWGCTIEYGGHASASLDYAMVMVNNGTAGFYDNCVIRMSNNAGVRIASAGNVNLTNSTITANTYPVIYAGPGSVVFNDINNLTGNSDDVIYINFTENTNTFVLDTVDIPYEFAGGYTIGNNGTLQVESGNVLLMKTYLRIRGGVLNAYYSRFTSDQSPRNKGDWETIEVGYSSTSGEANFWGCIIEYGGYSPVSINYAMVEVNRGSASFYDNSILRRSNNVGIKISSAGNVNLTNSVITENSWPVLYTGPGSLIFSQTNDLTGNTHDGIHVRFTILSGTFQLDSIDVPYYFYSSFTVRSGATLEIASGNIIKTGSSFYIEGTLVAIAGVGEYIYFTTFEDDNLGGDTNDDGTATTPNSRDWGSIRFQNSSNDATCILKRCKITFGGSGNHGGVVTDYASPTIDSCEFANNYFGAEFIGLSNPKFRYNLIGSSDMVPIAMSFDADPVFENNTFSFSDNEYDAIGLLGGTLAKNALLKQRDVTGIPNVTFLMLGRLTIPEIYSLTINKGIVIKGYSSYHRIVVKGALHADGRDASNRIVITSAKDDNHGNPMDTNKDGTQSEPDPGDWGGIVFEGTSADTCLLNFCRLKYARMPSSYYNTRYIYGGTVTTVNSNPKITNCIINNTDYGIYAFQASNPVIENNEISNTRYTPIALSVSADPTFDGNSFVNTGWTALGIIGEKLGFDGTVKLRNVASYDSIAYVLLEDLTINSGTYVDMEAGVVLKMDRNTDIFVNGGFQAIGTKEDTIVITSIKDDNYGNPKDTEDDGDATSPSSGDWGNIRYQATSDDAYDSLDYCLLLYGGDNQSGIVTYSDAGGEISNSLISDSYYYGLRCEGTASPVCSINVEIKNCRWDPIAMSLKSDPTFSFSGMKIKSNGNGSNGIRILEGTLSSDATLIKRDVGGIYNIAYIVDRLTVASDATLTITPGVVIKFLDYNSSIEVDGAFVADGKPSEKIVFTSLKDDSKGGDTNDDGNTTAPEKGDWWCIVFNDSERDTANLLNNCLLNYGAADQSGWADRKDYGTIRVFNALAEVDSCRIEQAYTSALGIYGSAAPSISNCDMHNVRLTPVTMSMFASPVFSENVTSNLGINAIGVAQETYALDATIPVRNFAGYENITYFLYRPCTINSGTILTVPAGVVFKADYNDCFEVEGAVLVRGTESEPVVFTHEHDDAYGNPMDTNEDGDETSPTIPSSRYHLDFADISNDTSTIRHAIFRYSNAGINLRQASPKIKSSRFEQSNWGVILNGVSTPEVDTNAFHNLTYAPMQISLVSYPASTGENIISGTTYKAIGVLDEELVQDVTLTKKTFAGIENIPYYFHGDYTIGTSVVLTIDPGLVLKFNDYSELNVFRGLIADGGATADSIIVFTSIRDDFYGGDSNTDGNATTPGGKHSQSWDGIIFDNQALDNLCLLDHCVVKYAGWYNYESAVTTESASPKITYSTFSDNSNGVLAEGASNPLINYCDIYDNKYYGINNVNKAFTIDARYNWWGSNTGPTHTSNPGGTGDAVSDMVDYSDFRIGSLNPAMGDVSLNGYIQAFDASLILQDVAMINPLEPEQEAVADVSDNGEITAYDASLILQLVAGSIDVFPAELKSYTAVPDPIGDIRFELVEEVTGEQITVGMFIEEVNSVSAFEFNLEYDAEELSISEIKLADLAADMNLVHNLDPNNRKLLIAMAGSQEITSEGAILYLTFDYLKEGLSSVSLRVSKAMANEVLLINTGSTYEIGGTQVGLDVLNADKAFSIYPNPTSGEITVTYEVPVSGKPVQISVYDVLGAKVAELLYKIQPAGRYTLSYDLQKKIHMTKGLYYIRLTIGEKTRVQKIIVH